jgi:hypothetical protein
VNWAVNVSNGWDTSFLILIFNSRQAASNAFAHYCVAVALYTSFTVLLKSACPLLSHGMSDPHVRF